MDTAEALLSLSKKELDQLPAELRQKIELARQQVFAAQRLKNLKTAKDNLLDFTTLSMPDPAAPNDPLRSRYEVHKVHRFLAKKLEQVATGEVLRLAISVQPRVGKSFLSSQNFPAWLLGRDPYHQCIVTGYSDDFVKDFGRYTKTLMTSPFYNQVFPNSVLNRNSKAANHMMTEAGGILHFAGWQGSLTGRGADTLIIDDLIRGAEEARSRTTKDKQWEWFTRDASTRVMGTLGAIVIVATRWAEDDLIGRLTDVDQGFTSPEEAAQWEVVNIPAFAEENDPLGRELGEVLWEERTPAKRLNSMRKLDPAGFAALYMGRPAPPEGNFFKSGHFREYRGHQLPANLRYFSASDHAISTEQRRDSTVLGTVGVDEHDNIYIMSDLVWAQLDSDDQVESMLALMQKYRPLAWWAEKGHISKSIGPFLRKRMREENTYCNIIEKTPVKDKMTRAQSIHARMAMGKVFWPAEATWFAEAKEQLLNFPNGAHDDVVDWLAWIGIGLDRFIAAEPTSARDDVDREPPSGSLQYILKSSERLRKEHTEYEGYSRYLQ